jgi:DNA-binding GntR family transcriptional regulator
MSGAATQPRYLQVAEELRQSIQDGSLRAEGRFPTEAVLCKRYNVSRFTVREALRRLEADGLISRRRGSGTRVEAATTRAGMLRQPLSNVKEILQYAHDTRFDFEALGLIRLGKSLAHRLGAKAGERWFRLHGLRTAKGGGAAIALSDVYLHREFADAVAKLRPGPWAVFEQLEAVTGIRVARITQDIHAVVARKSDAQALDIPPRSPCLRIVRSYYDPEGRLILISNAVHPGSRFSYSMHIER